MRKNIENITNELAQGAGLDFELFKTYNAIIEYCKRTNTLATPRKNSYNVTNGALFINNEYITRVAPLPARVAYDEAALYYEGLILAAAEIY